MFKIQPKPTFWAKVSISIPGETKPGQIEVEFRHMPRDELRVYFDGLEGKSDADALGEIVTGWKGVDEEFSQSSLANILNNYPSAALAFFDAFRREALEAKGKN